MTSKPYSVYHQISSSDCYSYKLLQLTPDLLEYIKDPASDELVIKASRDDHNHLVLCTDDRTWKLRQMNHSNTVLLLNDMGVNKFEKSMEAKDNYLSDKLVGFASLNYEYEPTRTKGYININRLPIYDGSDSSVDSIEVRGTVMDLCENSPISANEFFQEWYNLCGSEVDGRAVILARNFVTDALKTLITILIAQKIDYKNEDVYNINLYEMIKLMQNENEKYTQEVTRTILNKFGESESNNNLFRLKGSDVSKWLGLQTLHETSLEVIPDKEFLLKWKSSFPAFYNVSIDINQLRGYFCRPIPGRLQYLNPTTLNNSDMHSTVKELFQIVKEWDFDDFFPFIEKYIPPGKKAESIILKYAKRKKVGKNKFTVSPR